MKSSTVVAIAINAAVVLLGLYVVSYATIPLPPMHVGGGGLTAYDPEIGLVARPNNTTRRVAAATENRCAWRTR
jgi:hypothetical protein